ncbi:hypothetical protein DCS32_09495 [Dokdonia sp. Dokd-P16]|uniref:hypothetical protein n=1 Tax=Dokdonia sp. Dokd-P16 TaxID=2173169 RepID=UPI000D54A62C|nr:hypothetical protein [Dokdonia sp. Dokd-P16]AWH74383.1 hypothetical protein DCS32_09495 [Dokdonia sp. Dokd-P16]
MRKKIKRVFARIINGKQLIGFEIANQSRVVFLTGSNVKQNTNLEVYEVEMLTDSFIKPIYYKQNETMFNGKVCTKDDIIIKDFWITMVPDNYEEFKEENSHKLMPFRKIKQIFTFTRNGKVNCGIKNINDDVVFVTEKRLSALTNLDSSEFHILEGSFINPSFYEDGEIMANGSKCYGTNKIVKELNLRFLGNINQMHENFENSEPKYYISNANHSYDSSYEIYGGPGDGYGGHLDDDFINDVLGGHPDAYWNID